MAAAVARSGVDLPCSLPRPVPTHLKLPLTRSTKVLNTSHSCWLTQSGVRFFLTISVRQQKFIPHQTRLVPEPGRAFVLPKAQQRRARALPEPAAFPRQMALPFSRTSPKV